MIKLDELHTLFRKPTREQTIRSKFAGLARIRSVEFKHRFRFVRQIHYVRHAGLHPVGHLVLRDARVNLRVTEFIRRVLMKFL